ncbi:MAG: hypothetical protein WB815_12640 [Nitrososphaeraceae archaeon]
MAGNVLETIGQQQNGIRTVSPADVMQGTALASINLTQGYFNRVSDALNNARQELHNNDFLSAYGELSSASNSLFAIISDPNNRTSAFEQLMPLQTQIVQTQQALFQGNLTKALNSLDTTELELHKMVQLFPPGREPSKERQEDNE